MIGHYVHHHGSGHLHRAMTIAPHLPEPVTGLSSLPRPDGWQGDWVQLPRDDSDPAGYATADVTAGERLHWVPLQDDGLRERTHALSSWIERERPSAMLVDQSVEVTLTARLHGVPVVGFTAPGHRGDPAHTLGFDVCSALVGAWPEGCTDAMLPGVPERIRRRFTAVGGCSRFPVALPEHRPGPGRRAGRHVVVIAGDGGDSFSAPALERARASTPDWTWTVLSRRLGTWHPDPAALLATADVAVIHAGQNSVAEVASLRVPAVVVPQPRPFDEQVTTATVLSEGWPALVLDTLPDVGWSDVLEQAASLDGDAWQSWCDGRSAERVAALVRAVIHERRAA